MPNYTNYKNLAMKGSVALLTDTIKVALLTSSYTPDLNAHVFFSDVSSFESSGTGYTSGGATLTSPTVTSDSVNNRALFNAANVAFTSSTIANARYALIYKSTGVSTTSPLIGYIDFGSTQSTSSSTFSINWSTSPAGIFYLS